MSYALQVQSIGKKYNLKTTSKIGSHSMKHGIANLFKSKIENDVVSEINAKEFWALKNINFSLEQGARLGVIGKNGAGKSTLLKILSRITEPTEGKILVNGKMASLLEVGTGFHPELTGRENVFLNGAILGLPRAVTRAKFDQILDFSGVEKFIDMPVKHYSSGMQVRLAFAVAAHLEPDILVLDEVLAVGDAAFQKKCLKKMNDISDAGTTVIFVSHGMSSIQEYCNQALLLEDGRVKIFTDNIDSAVNDYLDKKTDDFSPAWERKDPRYDNDFFLPNFMRLVDHNDDIVLGKVSRGDQVYIEIGGIIGVEESDLTIGYCLFDENGSEIYWSYPTDDPKNIGKNNKKGKIILKAKIPLDILNSGRYTLGLIGGIHNKKWIFQPHNPIPYIDLEVKSDFSESKFWKNKRPGLLAINSYWEIY